VSPSHAPNDLTETEPDMTQEPKCPSCGRANAADALECENCSYPLNLTAPPVASAPVTPPPAPEPVAAAPEPAAPPAPAPAPAPSTSGGNTRGYDPNIKRMRTTRPRAAQTAAEKLQFQLWLVLGGFAVLLVMYTAFQGFQKNNAAQPKIAGANEEMEHAATMARNELAKDSTNVNARIMLANILYDTANWPEAIIHYKSALRSDSTRVTTLVDLGVCYFNLGDSEDAIEKFRAALRHEPNHPVALFNMGVVAESKNELDEALGWYAKAQKAGGPQGLQQSLAEAMQRAQQKKSGGGAAGGGMGGR
jgi:hypothetical protein